jgi:chemotaxis protein CheD
MVGVRMAEMAVSKDTGEELVALGLGSCIGLAIVDRSAGVAGLAHIVLPESGGATGGEGKFADTAVPELLARMAAAGGVARRYEVAIAGGARMFATSAGLDIGARNADAVMAALRQAGLKVARSEVGGNQGRTVRIDLDTLHVTSRVAGATETTLLAGTPAPSGRAGGGPGRGLDHRPTLRVAGANA